MNSNHLAQAIYQTAEMHLRAAIRTQLEFQPHPHPHHLYTQLLQHSKHYHHALTLLYTMLDLQIREKYPQVDSRRVARQRVKQLVKSLIQMEIEAGRQVGQAQKEDSKAAEQQRDDEMVKEEAILRQKETEKEQAMVEANGQAKQQASQSTPRVNVLIEVKTEDMSYLQSQSTRKDKDFIASSPSPAVDGVKVQICDVIDQTYLYGHFMTGDKLQQIKQIRKINEQIYVVVSWLPRQSQFQPSDSLLHSECVNLYAPTQLATFCSNLINAPSKQKPNT